MQNRLTRDMLHWGDQEVSDRLSHRDSRQATDFPRSLSEWVAGQEFFPRIYDEMVGALSELTDYDYARVVRLACGPLDIDMAKHNFAHTIHFLNAVDKLAEQEDAGEPHYQSTPFLVTAPQRFLMRLYATVVFCHEKFLPAAKMILRTPKPRLSLLSAVVDDLSAGRFFDLRNGLAHWNAYIEGESLIFFSQREKKDEQPCDKEFVRKKWHSPAIYLAPTVTHWLCLAMFTAFQYEEERRSH